jgi:hypothetical protein
MKLKTEQINTKQLTITLREEQIKGKKLTTSLKKFTESSNEFEEKVIVQTKRIEGLERSYSTSSVRLMGYIIKIGFLSRFVKKFNQMAV